MQLFILGMSMYKSVYMYVCKFMTWNVDASVSKSERFCRLKFVCGLFDMRNKNNVSSYVHVGGDPKPRTRTNENSSFERTIDWEKGIIIRTIILLLLVFCLAMMMKRKRIQLCVRRCDRTMSLFYNFCEFVVFIQSLFHLIGIKSDLFAAY